ISVRNFMTLLASIGCFIGAPRFAGATVITRNIVVAPSDVAIVIDAGVKFASYFSPEPADFALSAGDSMDITLTFTVPMRIADLGTGLDNLEWVFMKEDLNFVGAATIVTSIEFTGVSGNLLINPLDRTYFTANFTDSFFSFTGIHYQKAVSNTIGCFAAET